MFIDFLVTCNNVLVVHIFDTRRLSSVNTISAHNSQLAALRFNEDGQKLATASVKGTVIRVFNVESGDRLFEFRRGVKRLAYYFEHFLLNRSAHQTSFQKIENIQDLFCRYVTISSLAFSADSVYLCCSSNTETVHVFKLERTDSTRAQE